MTALNIHKNRYVRSIILVKLTKLEPRLACYGCCAGGGGGGGFLRILHPPLHPPHDFVGRCGPRQNKSTTWNPVHANANP